MTGRWQQHPNLSLRRSVEEVKSRSVSRWQEPCLPGRCFLRPYHIEIERSCRASLASGWGRITMRILVTGITGFAGGHLAEALSSRPGVELFGLSRHNRWPAIWKHVPGKAVL